jgi:uncharacterized membrane protein YfcA
MISMGLTVLTSWFLINQTIECEEAEYPWTLEDIKWTQSNAIYVAVTALLAGIGAGLLGIGGGLILGPFMLGLGLNA